MDTISSIIKALGGSSAVARAVGVGASTVGEWKRSGSVPVKYWPRLFDHAASLEMALNADLMLAAHTAGRDSDDGANQ